MRAVPMRLANCTHQGAQEFSATHAAQPLLRYVSGVAQSVVQSASQSGHTPVVAVYQSLYTVLLMLLLPVLAQPSFLGFVRAIAYRWGP